MTYILTTTMDMPISILKGSPLHGIYERMGVKMIRELMVEKREDLDGVADMIRNAVRSNRHEFIFVSEVIDEEGNDGPMLYHYDIFPPEVKA